jgi:hypothetical protein
MGSHPSARWLAVVLLLATAIAADGQQAPPPPRIFHLDLHTLGAIGLEAPWSGDFHKPLPPGMPDSVSFLDGSRLAVSFPIFNPRTELSTRNEPRGGSHLFHTALIDVPSGRVVAETSWGTAHDEDAVLALPRGRFLVRSADKLALASGDGKQEQEHSLPEPGPGERPAKVLLSPSGQTVFVVMKRGEHQEHVEVLASATLTRLYAFGIESVGLDAGSDSYFAYLLPGKNGYALFELPLNALGKDALPPLAPLYFTQGDGCNRPDFVTDDVLLLTGYCDAVTLIAPDGGVKAQRHFGATMFVSPARPSRQQQRFAVSVARFSIPVKTERTPDPVQVYDTSPLAPVAEVELPPHSEEYVPRLDLALSADGALLAVLYGFDLSVYRLPPPPAGPASPAAATPGPAPATSTQAGSATPAPVTSGVGDHQSSEFDQLTQTAVQHGPGIDVAVGLTDLHHDAIRAWVQISNHGTTDVALAPEKATLEILNPGHKVLPAMNPDKLATAIQRIGEDDGKSLRSGCEATDPGYGTAPCPKALASALEIERTAEATAADVRSSALRAQVLKPGEQAQGAIFFTYQKKRGESVLRLPVGDQVFEFHFSSKKQ